MSRMNKIAIFLASIYLLATPAVARNASCEITLEGQRIDGACDFQARKGGSFDVTMNDGRGFAGARTLSLDVLRKGIGEIRIGSRSYGAANRSGRDPACWAGNGVTVCVRAAGGTAKAATTGAARNATRTTFTHPTDLPMVIEGRCHMENCWWVKVSSIEKIGEGSAAIPGTRLRAMMSYASNEYGSGGRPVEPAPNDPIWEKEDGVQIFCSMRRPAYLAENRWDELNPARVGGATEGMTNIYLSLCHAGQYRGSPYDEGRAIGYSEDNYTGSSYKTFSQLIAP